MTLDVSGVIGNEPAVKALVSARDTRGIFLQLTPARAEQDAARASTYGGPLAGVPLAVKDVFDLAGTRTTGASQLLDQRAHARQDAEAVRRLTEAGAVCIGKTTLSELAYSGLGVNDRFGTPVLRRDGREYLVGGSSSGSAAAVHAGIVPVALASDTSGSARIPAAWAGVFGFRPSLRRYPGTGMLPLAPTLDTVGIIAADARTLLAVDSVLAADSGPADSGPATYVLPQDEYLESCDDDVLERFHATVDALRARGLRFQRRRLESLEVTRAIHAKHLPIVEEEALTAYGPHLDRDPGQFGAPVRRRLERAQRRVRERSAEPLRAAMPALRAAFRRELGDGILVSPPVELDAPTLQEVQSSPETEDALNARALRLTMALSYLDSPSAVMPVGSGGTPTCLQLSARSGGDRRVLSAVVHLSSITERSPGTSWITGGSW